MLLFENISLAFSSILANKMRALLTMLGIIIGIASVIAIETVGESLKNSFSSSMDDVGANNIIVQLQQKATEEDIDEDGYTFKDPTVRRNVTKDDLITDEMIDGLLEEYGDDINAINIENDLGTGSISFGTESVKVLVKGVNDGYFYSWKNDILYGVGLGDKALKGGKGVALMSDRAAEKLYKKPENAVGREIEVVIGKKFYSYTVVGVYEYEANQMMMMAGVDPTTELIVPVKYVQDSSHTYGYRGFTAVSSGNVSTEVLMSEIEGYFDKYYHSNRYFAPSTFSLKSIVETMTSMLDTVSLAISIIAGISLVVGGIGVMNIMLVSISERTREIGTRKALGATNASIRTQFIVESMILCLIGGVIGIVIGVAGGSYAAVKMGYQATSSVKSIVTSVAFSLAIGVFFGYYPANKAAKMNPIDALRYE